MLVLAASLLIFDTSQRRAIHGLKILLTIPNRCLGRIWKPRYLVGDGQKSKAHEPIYVRVGREPMQT